MNYIVEVHYVKRTVVEADTPQGGLEAAQGLDLWDEDPEPRYIVMESDT
jgi:hypothetical protein